MNETRSRISCPLLLTALAPVKTSALDVTRFGAKPDDGQDDTAAFLAAFKQAKAKGERRIVIPKGRFELRANGNPERPDLLFPIADIYGLVIEGSPVRLADGTLVVAPVMKTLNTYLTLKYRTNSSPATRWQTQNKNGIRNRRRCIVKSPPGVILTPWQSGLGFIHADKSQLNPNYFESLRYGPSFKA